MTSQYDLYVVGQHGVPYYAELSGEDLTRYSNKIEPGGLRTCLYHHHLTKKVMSQ